MHSFVRSAVYFVVALLFITAWWFFKLLPVDIASALGGLLGRLVGRVLPERHRARRNLQRIYPQATPAFMQATLTQMWDNLGRNFGEMPHIKKIALDPQRLTLEGLEHTNILLPQNGLPQPGLIFSGHFANWEVAPLATAMALNLPLHIIYRVMNNPYVEKVFLQARENISDYLRFYPKGRQGSLAFFKALRQGGTLGIMLDQKLHEGIMVPFMGHPAKTQQSLATFALKYKAPVVPVQIIRTQGARFILRFHPPLWALDTDDIITFTQKCTAHLERWIEENPGQWFWVHNRWSWG